MGDRDCVLLQGDNEAALQWARCCGRVKEHVVFFGERPVGDRGCVLLRGDNEAAVH